MYSNCLLVVVATMIYGQKWRDAEVRRNFGVLGLSFPMFRRTRETNGHWPITAHGIPGVSTQPSKFMQTKQYQPMRLTATNSVGPRLNSHERRALNKWAHRFPPMPSGMEWQGQVASLSYAPAFPDRFVCCARLLLGARHIPPQCQRPT